jgi:hypothetical protein
MASAVCNRHAVCNHVLWCAAILVPKSRETSGLPSQGFPACLNPICDVEVPLTDSNWGERSAV